MAYFVENIVPKEEFSEEVVVFIVKSCYFQDIIDDKQTYVRRINCSVNRKLKHSNKPCINKLSNSDNFMFLCNYLSSV